MLPPFPRARAFSSSFVAKKKQQDVGWMTRKAIQFATITLDIKHYTQEGTEHIDIAQTLTGGIKGTTELRTLDWQERPHNDHIFGNLVGKSRRLEAEEVEDEFLREGWELADENTLVESFVVNGEKGWSAQQVSTRALGGLFFSWG
jgi:hypothetical protein